MGGKSDKRVVIVGAGGHGKVVASVIESTGKYHIVGFVDVMEKVGEVVRGYKVIGTDDDLPYIYKDGVNFAAVGIGSVGDVSLRKRVYERLKSIGFVLPAIVSNYAFVDSTVTIGEGSVIVHGAVIQPDVKIDKMAIINTKASVDHDCIIGDFTHVAPGTTLSGNVILETEVHIGTGAKLIQGVRIGRKTIIGAGAVVVKDIPSGVIAKGVPARW